MKALIMKPLLALVLVFTLGCSSPEAAERTDDLVEADPREVPDQRADFEARPDIETALDEAVEQLEGDHDYRLLIAQDGRHHPVADHTVELEPRPFVVWVVAPEGVGALVNAWHHPEARNRVLRDEPLDEPLGHPGTGMAEEPFNQQRLLMLDPEMSNYWIYPGEDRHRFDEVDHRHELVVGRRTVERIRDTGADETMSVAEFGGDALHVVEFEHRPMEPSEPRRAYTIEFRAN